MAVRNHTRPDPQEVPARLEFHRHAVALMPAARDQRPGVAFYIDNKGGGVSQRFCTCHAGGSKTCAHLKELAEIYKKAGFIAKGADLGAAFKDSLYYRLAAILTEHNRAPLEAVRPRAARHGDRSCIKVFDAEDTELCAYSAPGSDGARFLERCRVAGTDGVPLRGDILRMLRNATLTANERLLLEHGSKTRGQALEESFWHGLAYHLWREHGADGCTFHPSIDMGSGMFTLLGRARPGGEEGEGEGEICRIAVPRPAVPSLLAAFRQLLPNQHDLPIHPVPLKSIFKVALTTELDLEILPGIRLLQENGEEKFYGSADLEHFRYGNLVYLKDLGILAELEPEGRERHFRTPVKMVLKRSQVPAFLEEHADDIDNGAYRLDDQLREMRIFKHPDRLEISPEAMERDWCWLSVTYGFGTSSVSLADILEARSEGRRYLAVADGWVDCQAEAMARLRLDAVGDGPGRGRSASGALGMSRLDLLRLRAASDAAPVLSGRAEWVADLEGLFELRPARAVARPAGLTSSLRPYQQRGLEWLLFLYENGFSGLLCDDMGLGKTHQVMALMAHLAENRLADHPFLLVCPTTVLSHWSAKLRDHLPGLRCAVYHGGQRSLDSDLGPAEALLTSYGVLRNDIDDLAARPFSLAVFDEIQYLKNPATKAHVAARQLQTAMKLGLTGTPIENTLIELKNLFDLTLPGYLGEDEEFNDRYVQPLALDLDSPRRGELQRLISPFTLRRLKKSVLDELPAKIEDIRTCRLSEEQVKLYREAIAARGAEMLETLRDGGRPVPYLHIFALLNLLKRICDHPALSLDEVEDYEQFISGKWELFEELLAESLASGQKVVVYSQYLGMIRIMEKYLATLGVGHAILTGKSRNRGELIDRFNRDPACRVFVGSLKAGGVGIDLVAASVVIHYDRWWNAAREDQATDRVHRIGQNRGVQVFKLVTEGTLEEKISAIIARKRDLMDKVVQEDDPGLLKTFSRDQLLDFLAMPAE